MPPLLATLAAIFGAMTILVTSVSAGGRADLEAGFEAGASERGKHRAYTRHIYFVIPADGVERIEVASRSGNIELTGQGHKTPKWIKGLKRDAPAHSTDTDILVLAQVHAEEAERLNDVTLEPEVKAGVLVLKARWIDEQKHEKAHGVEYVIRMPGEKSFDLARGFEAVAGMGDVSAHGGSGTATARTGMGDVTIEQHRGEVLARSGMGDLTVELDASVPAPIDLATGMGDIHASGFSEGEVATSQGDIDAKMDVSPQGDVSIASGMGSVRLSVPENLDASIKATSAMGSVRVASRLSEGATKPRAGSNHQSVASTVGAGGSTIKCTTNMGSVVIN